MEAEDDQRAQTLPLMILDRGVLWPENVVYLPTKTKRNVLSSDTYSFLPSRILDVRYGLTNSLNWKPERNLLSQKFIFAKQSFSFLFGKVRKLSYWEHKVKLLNIFVDTWKIIINL